MTSNDSSLKPAPPSTPLMLTVKLDKCLMAFKNKKRAGKNRKTGKMFSYTESETKAQMKQLESDFESALFSAVQITDSATGTACFHPLWIRLLEQFEQFRFDDCRQQIPEMIVTALDGEEDTVTVIIEEYAPET